MDKFLSPFLASFVTHHFMVCLWYKRPKMIFLAIPYKENRAITLLCIKVYETSKEVEFFISKFVFITIYITKVHWFKF